MLEIAWETGERPLSDAAVRRAVREALRRGGRPGLGLSIAFVDDRTLSELHARTLGDPSPTDVLSFDLGEDQPGPAGEVIVSVDRAREVARERGVPLERELALYVVHGVLHLCGLDDRDPRERERMRSAERDVLDALGYSPDARPHDG